MEWRNLGALNSKIASVLPNWFLVFETFYDFRPFFLKKLCYCRCRALYSRHASVNAFKRCYSFFYVSYKKIDELEILGPE